MENIHKTFPGVVANDHIDFTVREGEIHGLLGENGAGKSTLMKVLFGLYTPDKGTIRYKGKPLDIRSPDDAIDAGIGMVHQHFKLIPKLSVTENVVLGLRETYPSFHADSDRVAFQGDAEKESGLLSKGPLSRLGRLFSYNHDLESERVRRVAEEYDIDIDPDLDVWQLEIGEQQRVEILKALYRDVDLLILDEPTAVLTPNLIERLFNTLEKLVEKGLTVVIITHKLDEVKQITDRVSVLREGKKVDTVETADVTEADLARMMVGRDVVFDIEKDTVERGEPVITVSDLRAYNDRGVESVSGVDLDIREGEILGLAGVAGNGMREIAECLVGVRDIAGGTIELDGTDVTDASTKEYIENGVSYVPPDRNHEGSAPGLNLVRNSIIKDYRGEEYVTGPAELGLDYGRAREHAEEIVDTYDVRVPSVDSDAEDLSGGNLQKMILGRELIRDPKLLVANQPTRGLDVGAIEFVREQILEQRKDGTGVLLISEELSEIIEMSDRVAVVYEGEIIHRTDADSADIEEIGLYMTGGAAGVDEEQKEQARVD
ncbi:ABC transporter ATP-binding protein [Natrarchaeobius chitinivorans]|uniref:ABC transporter ATP-binding protein n=2 Tax=Natrarchaeobius chitinivorans TaxID=1679083 RepID=A0A3N6ME42_NATCH|nr:ABC transporter ATP-binding protein [Natrarchaeobius chitinivorans]